MGEDGSPHPFLTGPKKKSDRCRYTAILTVISAVLFWLSTAHDEKEWTVASQITVISAFILSLLSALYMRTVVSMLIAITLLATLLLILTATKRRKQAVRLVPACKAVPKPYMKSGRPEHSGRLLYCDRTCCRWVRSHDIPSAAFQCRCLPACPAPSSRPASPQGPSPCRWPSCRRGASRWR